MPRFRNSVTGVVVNTTAAPAGAGWEALDKPAGDAPKQTRRKTPRQRTTAPRTAARPATGSTDRDDDTSASRRQDDD